MKFLTNRNALFAMISALIFIMALMSIDYNSIPPQKIGKNPDWALYQTKHPHISVKEKQILHNLNLWNATDLGSVSVSVAGEKSQTNWQLKGIVFNHNEAYILVLNSSDKKLNQYQLQEKLPNGELLVEITSSAITYQVNQQIVTMDLHKKTF